MKTKSLLQKITKQFPQLKWEKHEHITHGWDHDVIILDNKTVFRIPKNKECRNKFKNEINLLNSLNKKISIGIPNYTYISKNKTMGGYQLLKGQKLTAKQFKQLKLSDKKIIIYQLAAFLTTLHATSKNILKKHQVKQENMKKKYLEDVQNTRKMLYSRLSKKEINKIEKFFKSFKASLKDEYAQSLIHGELTSKHILWDKSKKEINIIDFSDRSIGDPANDFAGFFEYNFQFAKKIFTKYQGKKDDQMLTRAELYFKRIPLFIMRGALDGYPISFKKGYQMFKKRFKI